MNFPDTFHSNHVLLMTFNEMLGKDVVITVSDGRKYTGLFVACQPNEKRNQLDIGLKLAYELTDDNSKNLLPRASEVKEKMIFQFDNVISMSANITEEKPGTRSMGFATDRDYHGNSKTNGHGEDELERWMSEEDEGFSHPIEDGYEGGIEADVQDHRQRHARQNGWTPEEMFALNSKMHKVTSTFDENLSQYTTVEVEGTEEDRRRAEQLAREIEGSASSKFFSRLENDDDERDLDKETILDDEFETVHSGGPNSRRAGGNSRNSGRSGRGGQNAGQGGQINRRADGLKNDRRNSGGAPSGGRFQQQNQGPSEGGYAAAAAKNSGGGGGSRYDRDRRSQGHDDYPRDGSSDWPMNKNRSLYEPTSSANSSFKGQQKVILEPRQGPSGRAHHLSTDEPNSPRIPPGASQRTEDLKHWGKEFPIAYRNNTSNIQQGPAKPDSKFKPSHEPSEPQSPAATSSAVAAPIPTNMTPTSTTRANTGNAWNHGPPSSLVANKNSNSSSNNVSTTATPSTSTATSSAAPSEVPTPSASTTPVNAAPSTSAQNEKASTSADVAEDKKDKDSSKDTDIGGGNLSDSSSTANNNKKKFEFNVNAPEFKPRPQSLATQPPQSPFVGHPGAVAPHGMQQGPPHAGQQPHVAMQHIQGQPIVPGVPMVQGVVQGVQGAMAPPGMMVMATGWTNSPQAQQYQGYQLMSGQQVQMMPQGIPVTRNGGQVFTTAAPNRRQPNPATVYMSQQQQWPGQMMHVQQGAMPYVSTYQQYNGGAQMQPQGAQYQVPTTGVPAHQAAAGAAVMAGPGIAATPTNGPQQAVYAAARPGYPAPPMGYVMPPTQRYQGGPPQQGQQQGQQVPHDPAHYPQAAAAQQGGAQQGGPSGPNSQPATPGPQPPQPVPSPAQQQMGSTGSLNGSGGSNVGANGRSISPATQQQQQHVAMSQPPPNTQQQQQAQQQQQQQQQQQMMSQPHAALHAAALQQQQQQMHHAAAAHHQQHPHYATAVHHAQQQSQQQQQQQYFAQPMYNMYPQGTMIYQAAGGMHPGAHAAQQHAVMDANGQMVDASAMMQHPQYITDQYGNYIQAPQGYYTQGHQAHPPPPHAQAMSRQNSLPQQYGGQQVQGGPPGLTNQGQTGGPQQGGQQQQASVQQQQ